jgi:uncharacterized SAM-binding protein YcdF (DUF218 family)
MARIQAVWTSLHRKFPLLYYLSKILPLFLMPIALALGVSLFALFLILCNKRRAAIAALCCSSLILWIFACQPVATGLLWSLEKQYPPMVAAEVPEADCIVVLGGALGYATFPRVDIELADGVDRVYQAAKVYRLGGGQKVIVAAGNQPWASHLEPEASMIRDLLVQWGVRSDVIHIETKSRNTYENAVFGTALFREAGCISGLLVTSAWHMPRAKAAFRKQGIELEPVPVDLRSAPVSWNSLAQAIPRAEALAESTLALMEWLGIWVYRWKGWA